MWLYYYVNPWTFSVLMPPAVGNVHRLANDIALSGHYWTPIGGNGMDAFSGDFDGDGHTISGMDIAFPGFENEGLCGSDGRVRQWQQ